MQNDFQLIRITRICNWRNCCHLNHHFTQGIWNICQVYSLHRATFQKFGTPNKTC